MSGGLGVGGAAAGAVGPTISLAPPPPPVLGGAPGMASPNHKRRSHTSQLLAPGGPPGGPGSGLPGSGLHLYGGQQLGFKRPPPAAMPASSVQPTVPGCILTAADINLALVGRHAELYWPDDALWYLIEIQGVDLVSRMANIMYHSGEVEDLNLAEIVADRHMSLIPLDYYARRFGAP
ncbi:uncharacterized protein HaLaN_19767 [Haematococcus lacustris]|uniref:Uncharacterized protein n=2 Tax=Haematococcus lacustris TaxID=44745 RepID=A0A699ZVI1_HAELA|nr:uncharacterized protein HaLaN_19767 [Haematococcus lacustris]